VRRLSVLLALTIGCTAFAQTPPRGKNLLANPSFELSGPRSADKWLPQGRGYTVTRDKPYDGKTAIQVISDSPSASGGAMQAVVFDRPVRHPFVISGWSRAENVHGKDYCIYVDCWYADGTNLWGQRVDFEHGTHDWQYAELVIEPQKPVTKVQVHAMMRNCTGRAWFDMFHFSLPALEVTWEQVSPGFYGGNSIDYAARLSLPCDWVALVLQRDQPVYSTNGHGTHVALSWMGTDDSGQLLPGGRYSLRLLATDTWLQENLSHDIPVSTPSGAGRGYGVWTATGMERVLLDGVPTETQTAPSAQIALAGNESESFQVVLRAPVGRDLENCTVQIEDLVGPRRAKIRASQIQWQQVGFVHLARLHGHSRMRDAMAGWWPDPLLPVDSFTVSGGTTQSLWFTVYARPGTSPGNYRGRVTISPANAEPVQVPIEVLVYGFDLPVQPHFRTAFSLMDGFLEKIYGSSRTGLRRSYGDFMLAHRLNPDDISRVDLPVMEDLVHYNARGMNSFNIMQLAEPRGNRNWIGQSALWVYRPEFKADLIRRLDPFVEELKRLGLFEKAYIYGFDEVGDKYRDVMTEYFGMVKQRYGIPTLTTALVPVDARVLKERNISWICPITNKYDLAEAERCRRAGHQVWAYVASVPRAPYANWLADDPLIEARVLGWQSYHQKFDGLLYWGVNMWQMARNDHIIDPAQDGPRLKWSITTGTEGWRGATHGDGLLVYPGKDGPIGSIRLAAIRDGLEDYDYLALLAELESDPEAARRACVPVTEGLTAFTHDPARLYSQRDQIARRIEQLLTKERRTRR
jgi:hypothetical protein